LEPDFGLYGLLSWSNEDATTDELSYHGPTHRRTFPISLGNGQTAGGAQTPLPSDSNSFTLIAPEVTVSQLSGIFACSYHVLPVSQKVHIVSYKARYDPSSPSGAAGLQHHVDLMACDAEIPSLTDNSYVDCAVTMKSCANIMLSGGTMFSANGEWLPSDAGPYRRREHEVCGN